MPQHPSASRRLALLLVGAGLASTVASCQSASKPRAAAPRRTAATAASADAPALSAATSSLDAAEPSPLALPALAGPRVRPDVLVTATSPLTAGEIKAVSQLSPAAVAFATGNVHVNGSVVHVSSISPTNFRRFAAKGTAEATPVWQSVADGNLIVSHAMAKTLHLTLGQNVTVVGKKTMTLRLGALATTGIPDTELVVDSTTGHELGLKDATALLLNAGTADPVALASKVRKLTGAAATVDLLTQPAADPVAFLTGSRAAQAFGAFSYTYFADGTIQPDSRWVAANIVSATVPILGRVTCHRLMIPQLRGALQDVQNAGLASTIHTYDGCYVPRFIESNPTHAISLHTWGIAIDINASTNGRGTKGTMDPRVVEIFKRWGFDWGGDWSYTDPMHFQIGALLTKAP